MELSTILVTAYIVIYVIAWLILFIWSTTLLEKHYFNRDMKFIEYLLFGLSMPYSGLLILALYIKKDEKE